MQTDLLIEPRKLSPANGYHFFGYYDIAAFSADSKRHLCHSVPFWNRMPRPGDAAELGVYEVASGDYRSFASTRTWNFQQGAMLQWIPALGDSTIFFNDLDERGQYRGVVSDIRAGHRHFLDLPAASLDRLGRWALGINFSRLYAYRPGYGYCHKSDPFKADPHPDDDGVFLIDMESGASELSLSLQTIWELLEGSVDSEDGEKILINHITFNPSATRYLLLARVMKPTPPWLTTAITANRDGSDPKILFLNTNASHYWWSSDEELIIWGKKNGHERQHLYRIHEPNSAFETINDDFFEADGHCSVSPDGEWLLYDSYPNMATAERWQSLYLYHLQKRQGVELGQFGSMEWPDGNGDLRCDLHPRWAPDGRTISFDSTHDGHRALYMADLSEIMDTIRKAD